MDEIEARELRYFVAVAEALSFSGAAERLGISQPSLSRAIRQLETKLGVVLLERTTRHVVLTGTGAVLLERARPALEAFDAAARVTRRAGQADPRLAVTAAMGLDIPFLQASIAAYQRTNPDLPPARIAVRGWGRADAMLRDGRVDAALLRNPFDHRALDVEPLASEPRVALLSARHRLAARRRLHLADLAGEPVLPASSESEDQAGTGGLADVDVHELLEALAIGRAAALVPASFAERVVEGRSPVAPDLVSRTVLDLDPSTLYVAWLEASRSLAVAAFVRAAVEALAVGSGAADTRRSGRATSM